MFLGMVRLAPFVVLPLCACWRGRCGASMPAEGRLAADAAQSNPGRTAATAATLLVALSVVVVNATVAASFVGSVQSELDQRFARDLTVQPLGYSEYAAAAVRHHPPLRRQIAALPETGAVAPPALVYVPQLPGGDDQGIVVGYDPYEYDRVDHDELPGRAARRGPERPGAPAASSRPRPTPKTQRPPRRRPGAARGAVRHARRAGRRDRRHARGRRPDASRCRSARMAAVYGITTTRSCSSRPPRRPARRRWPGACSALLARDYPGLEALSNDRVQEEHDRRHQPAVRLLQRDRRHRRARRRARHRQHADDVGAGAHPRDRRAAGARRLALARAPHDGRREPADLAGRHARRASSPACVVAVVWVVGMRETTFPGMSMHLPVRHARLARGARRGDRRRSRRSCRHGARPGSTRWPRCATSDVRVRTTVRVEPE